MEETIKNLTSRMKKLYEALNNITDEIENIERNIEEAKEDPDMEHISEEELETASLLAGQACEQAATARDELDTGISRMKELSAKIKEISKKLGK